MLPTLKPPESQVLHSSSAPRHSNTLTMPWPSLWSTRPAEENAPETKRNHEPQQPTSSTATTSPPAPSSPTSPASIHKPWSQTLNSPDWKHYTTPQTITMSLLTTLSTLALLRLYKLYLRRIPSISYLKPTIFRKKSLYGYVTSVGDGDNFRFFHTPGGRWMGWGWLGKTRMIQKWEARAWKDQTLSIRIAGIDAPETAHFGRPAQPFAADALQWLRAQVLGRFVRVWPYRRDQYDRVVAAVFVRRLGFWNSDVGLEMLKRGFATVYEAKSGSEFGDKEGEYRAAEEMAKVRKVGMWEEPGAVKRLLLGKKRKEPLESPREYKNRMKVLEAENKTADLAK